MTLIIPFELILGSYTNRINGSYRNLKFGCCDRIIPILPDFRDFRSAVRPFSGTIVALDLQPRTIHCGVISTLACLTESCTRNLNVIYVSNMIRAAFTLANSDASCGLIQDQFVEVKISAFRFIRMIRQ